MGAGAGRGGWGGGGVRERERERERLLRHQPCVRLASCDINTSDAAGATILPFIAGTVDKQDPTKGNEERWRGLAFFTRPPPPPALRPTAPLFSFFLFFFFYRYSTT